MHETTLGQLLHWRYACKQFDAARQIPAAAWEQLEASLVLAPSSFGLQPWRFLVVESADVRASLRQLAWGQSQVTDASHFVVFAAQRTMTPAHVDRFIATAANTRGVPADALAGYKSMIQGFVSQGWASKDLLAWNTRQVYLALGQFMTAAACLGVDTCPMEGIDPAGFDRVLGLENSEFTTVVGCAAGYRSSNDKYAAAAKVRYPRNEIVQRV